MEGNRGVPLCRSIEGGNIKKERRGCETLVPGSFMCGSENRTKGP